MKRIFLIVGSLVFLGAGCFGGFGYERENGYDIKKDFCGKQVSSARCACAFHGKNCEPGEERGIVNKQIFEQFREWAQKQPEKE